MNGCFYSILPETGGTGKGKGCGKGKEEDMVNDKNIGYRTHSVKSSVELKLATARWRFPSFRFC